MLGNAGYNKMAYEKHAVLNSWIHDVGRFEETI